MLYQRGLLLVAMQPDPAVVPTFDPNTDAVLVEDPMYSIDPSVLERNFVRKSISVLPHAIGRKLAKITFTTEVRGNGKLQSGLLADAPLLGRLFRACSLSQTLVATAAATVPFKTGTVTGPTVSWSVGAGAITVTDRVTYTITVSTGGASGTAKVDITPDDVTVGGPATTAVTLTTATPLTVGNKGVTVTPTWSGSLVLGQKWVVAAQPKGVQYKPITDNPEMVAFRLYYDGVLHLMDRARGTFRIEAKAGNFAVLTWEFTGQYQDMVDAAIPDAVYEDTLPSQVELAHCLIDGPRQHDRAARRRQLGRRLQRRHDHRPQPDGRHRPRDDDQGGVRLAGQDGQGRPDGRPVPGRQRGRQPDLVPRHGRPGDRQPVRQPRGPAHPAVRPEVPPAQRRGRRRICHQLHMKLCS
jgi:hypothetical protein